MKKHFYKFVHLPFDGKTSRFLFSRATAFLLTGAFTLTSLASQAQTVIGGVNLGNLPNYLFFFANGSTKANWQGATKGFAGNVAIDGIQANETTSGGVPFAGTIYTNASSLGAWASIVDQNDPGQVNPAQAFGVLNQTTLISNLETDLSNAFSQINGLPVSAGFSSVSSTSLNGLNKQNGVAETFVVNVTSGLSISTKINITGDAGDVFILRWDSDANFGNGYQGTVKFQSGGAIVPKGGLKPSSFVHVAGNLNASGGGSTPAAPYPQGVKLNDGTGATIVNGSNFSGGGFFTGYWLTTGDPATGETSPFSNAIFVGGWYTTTNKFSMTSGTSGVYVAPPPPPPSICTPPAAAPECTPPTSWNVDKVVTGTQDWQALTGVSADNVTNKIRLTGSGTVIVNNKDLLLKSSGAVVYVNGPTLIINNGNLKTEVAGARFLMTNGTLRTYGNFQQSPNSVVCITNSTVDIGEEQAGVNFTSQTSTSADFQNDGGYRYLNTVCMNVTHDFQLQSTGSGTGLNGVDVIINSCIEIGDRGLNHATPTAIGSYDGDDSGNWQTNNTQSIFGTDIVVANGDYQNSIKVMTLCDVDIKLNKSGNFQNNSGTITGQDLCVATHDVFENSGTWTLTQIQWYSQLQNSTNVPGAGAETTLSNILNCFVACCAAGQLGSLGDCVWNDVNQNGTKDSGENGVPNVTVQLRNCQDQVLQTTQTNASGIYGFTNLQAGCYRVCVVKPAGYTFSPQNVGSDATDSDVASANGCTANIDLSPGENDPTNDAGIFQSAPQPDCQANINISISNGVITVTGLAGAPVSSLQVFDVNFNTIFNCFGNCGATQNIAVSAGTYTVVAKYYTAPPSTLICEKSQTVTAGSVCENVTLGGVIGFGANCAAAVEHCPTNGAASTIVNCTSPSGGAGALDIIWLKSTTSCLPPTTTAEQIIAGQDPHWSLIPGETSLTLSPGTVTQNTCYLRCARRAGCPTYIESNIISLTIAPGCSGGGNPDCNNIGITPGNGSITVTGIAGAPVTSVQVFNASYSEQLYNCFGNCASPTATFAVSPGTYNVSVKYYTAPPSTLICEKNQSVSVVFAAQGFQGEAFQLDAIKGEEFTELYWVHNGGYHVERYILERSADGIEFEEISVKASEVSQSHEFYQDYDLEPLTGDNFYRVKMVNTDGSLTYSEVQKVSFPDLVDYTIFPNPANDFAKLNLETVVGKKDVTITVFNNLGLEVKRFELEEVWSKNYQMDIRSLQEGHYIVWLNVPGKRPLAKSLFVGKL